MLLLVASMFCHFVYILDCYQIISFEKKSRSSVWGHSGKGQWIVLEQKTGTGILVWKFNASINIYVVAYGEIINIHYWWANFVFRIGNCDYSSRYFDS